MHKPPLYLSFDLDDTLWPIAPTMVHAEQVLVDWLVQHAPRLGADFAQLRVPLRAKIIEQNPDWHFQVSRVRRLMIQQALQQAGYSLKQAEVLSQQAFAAYLQARQQVTFFQDTLSTLQQLAKRYPLLALTNGNADIQQVGLSDYFQHALNAEQIGVGKPDPQAYQRLLAVADITPAQLVHIGDNPQDDILGAQQMGIRTVWFNPTQVPWQHAIEPTYQIQRLAQLLDIF